MPHATYHSKAPMGRLYSTNHTNRLNNHVGHHIEHGRILPVQSSTEFSYTLMNGLADYFRFQFGGTRLSAFFRRYGQEVIGKSGLFYSLHSDDVTYLYLDDLKSAMLKKVLKLTDVQAPPVMDAKPTLVRLVEIGDLEEITRLTKLSK